MAGLAYLDHRASLGVVHAQFSKGLAAADSQAFRAAMHPEDMGPGTPEPMASGRGVQGRGWHAV
jgi:hypothetical protein